MRRSPTPAPHALLTVRAALILGISGLAGTLAAILVLISAGSLAKALLAASAVTAGSIGLLNQIVGADTEHPDRAGGEGDENGPRTV